VTYTVTATNHGPSDLTDLVLADPAPAGATFSAATVAGGRGTCTVGASATCTITSLPAGATATATLTARLPASLTTGAAVTNVVTATAAGAQLHPSPATAGVTASVIRRAALAATLVPRAAVVAAGDGVVWDAGVTDAGPSDATNLAVTAVLPAGLSFDPATSSPTCRAASAATVTCTGSDLAAGTTGAWMLGTTVAADAGGTITGTITAVSAEASATARASVDVIPAPVVAAAEVDAAGTAGLPVTGGPGRSTVIAGAALIAAGLLVVGLATTGRRPRRRDTAAN
jgi:uncharacterized repeat protein (TIGR01451 family)